VCQHHTQGIAGHEAQQRTCQAQYHRAIDVIDGDGKAGGVAAHERYEIAQGQQTDGIGHPCQYRQAGHQPQPYAAS